MAFFVGTWIVIVLGWLIHLMVDRRPGYRAGARSIELALLWVVVVGGGAGALLSGLSHLGPHAGTVAQRIGYPQSMFQWEVGCADISFGVLGVACAWRRMRAGWLTAAVVSLAIFYTGAAIGHLIQLMAHDNHAPDNVSALPSDLLQVALSVVLLVAYRRTRLGARWT